MQPTWVGSLVRVCTAKDPVARLPISRVHEWLVHAASGGFITYVGSLQYHDIDSRWSCLLVVEGTVSGLPPAHTVRMPGPGRALVVTLCECRLGMATHPSPRASGTSDIPTLDIASHQPSASAALGSSMLV